MGWDGVPWVVGGQGVKHNANIARVLAYAAFDGREGIIGTRDLEVAPTEVLGPQVRVLPGACAIANRNAGAQYEAYAARLPASPTPEVVSIVPTGSSAGRCDLIVAVVENPYVDEGTYEKPTPQQIADGTAVFVRTAVLTLSVANRHPTAAEIKARIGSMSAIPLASVLQPVSNGQIASTMIRSQRRMASQRNLPEKVVVNPTASVTLNSPTYKRIAFADIEVPDWATHVTAVANLAGAKYAAPGTAGGVRIAAQAASGSAMPVVYGEGIVFDSQSTNADRIGLMAAARYLPLPTAIRGGVVRIAMEGARNANQKDVVIDQYTAVAIDALFIAIPESNFPALTFA